MSDQPRCLIVGATGGIGRQITGQLAASGARLVISGRGGAHLETLATQVAACSVAMDLRQPSATEDLIAQATHHLGGLDVMVNAAGVVAFGDMAMLDDDVLDELVAVDLVAAIRLTRAAACAMERGGVIVNVSGIIAELPTAGLAAYSAVKAGLAAFDLAAARELRRAGIRLIDARPPHTETGLAARAIGGLPPTLPPGRDPVDIACRIVAAIGDPRARSVSFDDA